MSVKMFKRSEATVFRWMFRPTKFLSNGGWISGHDGTGRWDQSGTWWQGLAILEIRLEAGNAPKKTMSGGKHSWRGGIGPVNVKIHEKSVFMCLSKVWGSHTFWQKAIWGLHGVKETLSLSLSFVSCQKLKVLGVWLNNVQRSTMDQVANGCNYQSEYQRSSAAIMILDKMWKRDLGFTQHLHVSQSGQTLLVFDWLMWFPSVWHFIHQIFLGAPWSLSSRWRIICTWPTSEPPMLWPRRCERPCRPTIHCDVCCPSSPLDQSLWTYRRQAPREMGENQEVKSWHGKATKACTLGTRKILRGLIWMNAVKWQAAWYFSEIFNI